MPFTVIFTNRSKDPLVLLTRMVGLKDPVTVGVPVMAPVEEFSESPEGRAPENTEKLMLVCPPVTVAVLVVMATFLP